MKSDLEMVHLWQINAMETQQALQFVMQLSHWKVSLEVIFPREKMCNYSKQDQVIEIKSLVKSDLEMVHLWQLNAMENQQAFM